MSCCNSYPACESSLPYACEPSEVTLQGKRVVVEDLSGCQKTIGEPDVPSLLRYNLENQKIEWVDQTDISGLPKGVGVLVSQVSGSPFWINGSNGQFLKIGAGGIFEFGSFTSWISVNSNTVLVGSQYILANTSAGPITLFLPTTPAVADAIVIADHSGTWATNNLTINRNSQTIDGIPQNLICNINSKLFTLIFNGATWRIFTV
jgi:hypothetical protein